MNSPEATPPNRKPAPVLLDGGEFNQFMLHTAAEIQLVLRGLYDHVSQITVFFNEGKDMLLTTLAEVADDHLILDYGPSSEMNRKALDAEKHFCVTNLDKVRVQFILRGLAKVELDGRPAFRAALPNEVLRLQRREYYRLVTPIIQPLHCALPILLPNGETHLHTANVHDISGGGLGITAPAEGIPFETGTVIQNCRLDLPEVGLVLASLKPKTIFEQILRSGARVRRAGCQFVKLPSPMATLIQRYIIKVERDRKAKESGMG